MDTKPLERFATWARQDLLTAVEAQATAVLKTDSVARVERAHAVRALEAEITRHGREHVIDKVAYTWFNRIIALRFMDARGYTDTGVVSPAQGQPHGQPEILADAKRGNIDTDVVTNSRTADAIIGLLDGTRRSTDAEGEAYALLLSAHCHYWHGPMPFMFEREDNYTELLVPTNLLADDAILSRAVEVLTENVCDDVEVIGWLYQFYISERKDEVFAGFKKNKKSGADEIPAATQLFTPHWIVRYLVENSLGRLWMLNHPSSRLVDQMDYYITPIDDELDFLPISTPEELTVIDPACGSGHILAYAFDVLYTIYEEEGYAPAEIPGLILTHNLHGAEIDPRAGSLASFALTMKARAKQQTFFNKQIEPKICVIEPISFAPEELDFLATPGSDRHQEEIFWNQFAEADVLGSLIRPDADLLDEQQHHLKQLEDTGDIFHALVLERAARVITSAEYLEPKYSVVIANPPYMGSGNMGAILSAYLRRNFPEGKSDLFAAFIIRCLNLGIRGAQVGLMSPFVWMFLKSYEELRQQLISKTHIQNLVQLEYSGFDGATVPICAFILRKGSSGTRRGSYVRLTDFVGASVQGPTAKRIISDAHTGGSLAPHLYRVHQSTFKSIPGAPIAYWLGEDLLSVFAGPKMGNSFVSGGRLKTHNDQRFVRFVWEVDQKKIGTRWRHLSHGGEFRRWYGTRLRVVRWDQAARDEYASHGGLHNSKFWKRPGITASKITSSTNSFRLKEDDQEYSSLAPTIFSEGDDQESIFRTLGILNSSAAQQLLWMINPSMTLNVGDVLMVPSFDNAVISTGDVEQLIDYARTDWDQYETSLGFERNPFIEDDSRTTLLKVKYSTLRETWRTTVEHMREIEENINQTIADSYQLNENIVPVQVAMQSISLRCNPAYRYGTDRAVNIREEMLAADTARELVSYAVGCMFGRYSLDQPGLILADQGETLRAYQLKVATPTFMPDADNVIPFVDDGWFEDDIVEKFREFLRTAFGKEHLEENLRFVEESLGVKTLRDYFIAKTGRSKFYDDHVQLYKKRPIYWMFSSPKGSFNALIYLHRYTPSTVSTVLNEYLREYRGKLEIALQNAEREAAVGGSSQAQKEADRIRKVLVELEEYEHDVLYPLATQQIVIDLDDGVKVNYPKFGKALKKIKGLEATE